MNSNLDPHIQLEEWLVDGAVNDPPREMAFHASMCDECLSRLNAFDSLAAVDVGAAGSPPPLVAPTRVVVGLAWARLATAAVGGILALLLVFAGASQLIGFVGHANKPDASLVAVASATEMQTDGGPIGTFGPGPATEPSPSEGPTPTPIPTFIPLPSVAAAAAPIARPNAPSVYVQSVGQTDDHHPMDPQQLRRPSPEMGDLACRGRPVRGRSRVSSGRAPAPSARAG